MFVIRKFCCLWEIHIQSFCILSDKAISSFLQAFLISANDVPGSSLTCLEKSTQEKGIIYFVRNQHSLKNNPTVYLHSLFLGKGLQIWVTIQPPILSTLNKAFKRVADSQLLVDFQKSENSRHFASALRFYYNYWITHTHSQISSSIYSISPH